MTFSTSQSSTELDWKSSFRQIFWECCIYMEVASCWGFRKMPIQDKRNNALAVFGNAITNADLKVYWHSWCSHPRQLVYKKNLLESSLSSLCAAVFVSVEKNALTKAFWKLHGWLCWTFLGTVFLQKEKQTANIAEHWFAIFFPSLFLQVPPCAQGRKAAYMCCSLLIAFIQIPWTSK